jgi:hypothetical protein
MLTRASRKATSISGSRSSFDKLNAVMSGMAVSEASTGPPARAKMP